MLFDGTCGVYVFWFGVAEELNMLGGPGITPPQGTVLVAPTFADLYAMHRGVQ